MNHPFHSDATFFFDSSLREVKQAVSGRVSAIGIIQIEWQEGVEGSAGLRRGLLGEPGRPRGSP